MNARLTANFVRFQHGLERLLDYDLTELNSRQPRTSIAHSLIHQRRRVFIWRNDASSWRPTRCWRCQWSSSRLTRAQHGMREPCVSVWRKSHAPAIAPNNSAQLTNHMVIRAGRIAYRPGPEKNLSILEKVFRFLSFFSF